MRKHPNFGHFRFLFWIIFGQNFWWKGENVTFLLIFFISFYTKNQKNGHERTYGGEYKGPKDEPDEQFSRKAIVNKRMDLIKLIVKGDREKIILCWNLEFDYDHILDKYGYIWKIYEENMVNSGFFQGTSSNIW